MLNPLEESVAIGHRVDSLLRVVSLTTMNTKQLIKTLERDGWTLRSIKRSNRNPTSRGETEETGQIDTEDPRTSCDALTLRLGGRRHPCLLQRANNRAALKCLIKSL